MESSEAEELENMLPLLLAALLGRLRTAAETYRDVVYVCVCIYIYIYIYICYDDDYYYYHYTVIYYIIYHTFTFTGWSSTGKQWSKLILYIYIYIYISIKFLRAKVLFNQSRTNKAPIIGSNRQTQDRRREVCVSRGRQTVATATATTICLKLCTMSN